MDVAPPSIDEQTVFRLLFTAYPDALLLVDASGQIVMANPAAAELLGYAIEELTGLSVDELVPDAIRPRHAAYRSAYARAPRARPMGTRTELVAKRRDGTQVMVEIALSPLQEQGLPYVVAAVRGIEGYPRVQQALQRARYSDRVAQFGRLAVDSRDPQQLLDEAPRVAADTLRVPHAAVYLLAPHRLHFTLASGVGLLPALGVGMQVPNSEDSLPGHMVASGREALVADAEHRPTFQVAAPYREAGLTSALAVPLTDRGQTIGVLAVRGGPQASFGDEELRFLQALASLVATGLQRARSDEALNHAQRLESVGQLTGGIAHDFNNLLTVISGNLQAMLEVPAVVRDPALQQMVGAAAKASRRAAELTEKLLAFSRRQVLQPSCIDIGRLVHSLADMLRRTLDQRIRIEVMLPDDDGLHCLADRTQLESALLNVAINARDAMPDGGTLTFTAQVVDKLPEGVAQPEQAAPGTRYVAVAMRDTGSGMSEAVTERAFEPFFTTKEAGRGTGLGLSTVYGFVTQSRGAVALQSAPGRGTTVTVYLPQPLAAGRPDGPAKTASSVPPGLRVLVVEDELEVRAVTTRLLAAIGCDVTACATAEEALALLERGPRAQPFDLLLTDIALGRGMRGTALARQAGERWPALKVLLMSGYSTEMLDMPARWPLLRKPYSRDALAQALCDALH
ncbi:PAS domain S-box protein [Aquincola sp. MAHUQ-54]|uniref:histidine kinase n=1 Tax=Aquincola agrisoli TaxID=3119538 RepID=A0AAW9QDS6_9BURK